MERRDDSVLGLFTWPGRCIQSGTQDRPNRTRSLQKSLDERLAARYRATSRTRLARHETARRHGLPGKFVRAAGSPRKIADRVLGCGVAEVELPLPAVAGDQVH